ncbi:MAG TPA: lysine--tRNA ligase [Candidatus Acidoferrum sp.]
MQFEPRDQFEQRQKKLEQIQALGHDPYPRGFRWTDTPAALVEKYGASSGPELEANKREVRVAGRMVAYRLMGKMGFAHLQGAGKKIQICVKKDVVGEPGFQLYHLLDLGDSIGVRGHLFRTKTNELTVWVEEIFFLSKALLPLPEKWHGLTDVELRYRQRYLDLIANEKSRQVFETRARIVRELRKFFDARGYIEVETPMMHPIAGGAAARPVNTHHHTQDHDLYLRIAPELYLKRLTVGGFDRVYEINRNFRNEGISTQHNPEFTMLEFYEAYSNYRDLMDMNEQLFALLAKNITGSTTVKYGEAQLDFSRFRRFTMREAIQEFWPESAGGKPTMTDFESDDALRLRLRGAINEVHIQHDKAGPWAESTELAKLRVLRATFSEILRDSTQKGKPRGVTIASIFEALAEEHLIQPTIIYEFPTDISPLSKQKPDDPSVTERFEIYVAGMEVANGFSELNDPAEQERRFLAQMTQGGEEVPKQLDVDYIRALCHGMPPTAGEGIGIDRLTMLLTDSPSIRDVILFPQLRPESGGESSSEGHGA